MSVHSYIPDPINAELIQGVAGGLVGCIKMRAIPIMVIQPEGDSWTVAEYRNEVREYQAALDFPTH